MTALLAIERLSAVSDREGGTPILRDVSLAVAPGEVHGLVGESGAGKSTVARAVLGMLPRSVRVTARRHHPATARNCSPWTSGGVGR